MNFSCTRVWNQLKFYAGILAALTASTALAQETAVLEDETITFFESGSIPELKLIIEDDGQQGLREAPRDYVSCSFIENGTTTLNRVGVKLKGAAGDST